MSRGVVLFIVGASIAGCASLNEVGLKSADEAWDAGFLSSAGETHDSNAEATPSGKKDAGAKTLLVWNMGRQKEESSDKESDKSAGGDAAKASANGKTKGEAETSKEKEAAAPHANGKSSHVDVAKQDDEGGDKTSTESSGSDKDDADKPLDTDRPDVGVATTTVGKGRAQFESGFSFHHDNDPGSRLTGRTYPEGLLRVGLFADWFEFRVGQSFAEFTTTSPGEPRVKQRGAQDLYLGAKLALTEQKTYLPESVLVIQSTAPTGSNDLTADRWLPGLIYSYNWEIIPDRLSFGGIFEADKAVSDLNHPYLLTT